MSSLTEIKKGVVINFNAQPCRVMEARFLRMQQRKPVMQTKLKDIKTDKVIEYSFKQSENIEIVDVVRTKANFLYKTANSYEFMEDETFEQVSISQDNLKGQKEFLKEGIVVDLIKFEDKVISVELPPKVDLKVTSAPPGIKGDSASGTTKQITLETGAVISAPLFVKEGDIVKVNTETGEYVERVS